MLPIFTRNNRINTIFSDIKLLCKFYTIKFFGGIEFSYSSYFGRIKKGSINVNSFRRVLPNILIKPKSDGMFFVLFGRNPLKIFKSVILAISIFMVNLSKVKRVWNIIQSHQTMYKKLFLFPVFIKTYYFIFPFVDKEGFKKSRVFPTTFTLFRIRPDLTILRNSIHFFKSFNIFHDYCVNGNSLTIELLYSRVNYKLLV